jgi:histone acetyltransferase MYST2
MTNEECKIRKEEIEKNVAEYKSKINQINENRKNLRNKQPTESQLNYFQLLKTKLKEKIKPNEQTLKSHLCDRLLGNTELLTDIKNITTSTLLNSMSIGINPTTSHASTSSSLAASKLIKSNLIYSCFNNKSITPTLVEDLNVSKFELDLFKDALVSSANSKEDKVKKLSLYNKNHKLIQFGNYEVETWYNSPYPDDYWQLDKIFICQYCLIYMKSHSTLNRHLEKCLWRHPPGREIYRKDKLSFFEVDGKFNKAYCQNLCLLAKLFLDHKTLYYDVEPFLFYVLTKYNEKNGSFEMVGYFSKEKQSVMNYNLSCILILPPFMNKSYGRLLIDFSYLLSRVEEKYGSPERPLSDLGLISYRNYWKTVILNYLSRYVNEPEISIKEASLETGIISNDIISTLQFIGLIKYWKGKHVLLKDNELIDKYVQKLNSSDNKLDPNCLKWTPYVWQTIINESDTPALSVFGKNRKN